VGSSHYVDPYADAPTGQQNLVTSIEQPEGRSGLNHFSALAFWLSVIGSITGFAVPARVVGGSDRRSGWL
jgi:hypothetical protein